MSVTLESVERINALKNGIEATTGETYADLTAGVQALKNGYGQGDGGGTEEIENLIDESGVLDSTDGTATEKVEQLIDKAEYYNTFIAHFNALRNDLTTLYQGYPAKQFPTEINLDRWVNWTSLFSWAQVESFDYYIDCSSAYTFKDAFRGSRLRFMVGINTSNATAIGAMFYDCTALETIQEPFDFSKVTNISNAKNVFYGCTALKDIYFVAETIKISIAIPSPVLSDESIQSIFDGLATVETAQTLTLNANAKILQSQVDSANAKGWTVAGGTVVSEEEYYG